MFSDFPFLPNGRLTAATLSVASCLIQPTQAAEEGIDPAPLFESVYALYQPSESFYVEELLVIDEEEQFAAIEAFAAKLVGESIDPPKEAVDVINSNFWDLL